MAHLPKIHPVKALQTHLSAHIGAQGSDCRGDIVGFRV